MVCTITLQCLNLSSIEYSEKKIISRDFNKVNIVDKLLHCVECTNFAYPLYDWDFKKRGNANDHYQRMENNQIEGRDICILSTTS